MNVVACGNARDNLQSILQCNFSADVVHKNCHFTYQYHISIPTVERDNIDVAPQSRFDQNDPRRGCPRGTGCLTIVTDIKIMISSKARIAADVKQILLSFLMECDKAKLDSDSARNVLHRLERILDGEEPNNVFNWRKRSYGEIVKQGTRLELAWAIVLAKLNTGASIEECVATLVEDTGETERRIRDSYEKYGPTIRKIYLKGKKSVFRSSHFNPTDHKYD